MTELLIEKTIDQEAPRAEQFVLPEMPVQRVCPHCGTHRIGRRSRIRWYDLPLLFLFVRPVRCTDCYSRYYRFIRSRAAHR